MIKSEVEFIKELENRAQEQRVLSETEIIPSWARGVGGWLAVNPWRVVVPIASMAYAVLRIVYGTTMREFILGLFGGY